jgi:tRNA 5-methylaminomethyl-2-thiouridine biosynthesis bifunctional protein
LAERGYAVQVLDQGQTPAAAASGLPVGLVAPHASPDDSVISRLSRAGVRAMRDAMERLLVRDQDWGDSGVQERRLPGKTRKGGAPAHWPTESQAWTRALSEPHSPVNALWHERGAWVRPAALVHALLQHPRITWQASTQVTHLQQSTAVGSPAWQVMHQQQVVAQADHVVLATGPATTKLLEASGLRQQATPIRPLRGQLSWGLMRTLGASHTTQPNALPASPVNGHGCFVHSIATDAGAAWFAGSTFDRERDTPVLLESDRLENLARVQALLPELATSMAQAFASGQVRDWAGVRCSVPDRLPMVGAVPHAPDGLWLCAALGSRGLTLSVLCGELLAAQWCGEPPPIEPALARALSSQRFIKP